jgi:nucleoside-diphosphate-sugar epimerase
MGKILVTGASGQIGTFLTKKLNENKKKIVCLDLIKPKNTNLPFLKIDLKNKNEFKKAHKELEDIEILIHLASIVNSGQNVGLNGIDSVNLNIHGTLNLLDNLPNLKQISFASSYMVYGKPKMQIIHETHATNPENIYGASKLITEKILQVFSEKKKINLNILRFMGIYGIVSPYVKQAIPSFIEKILDKKNPTVFGTGNVKRNHIYIDDAIDAIIISINNKLNNKLNNKYNIGGIDSPSNLELIKIINNEIGTKIKPNFMNSKNKEYSFITDINNANKKLGFKPKIGIKEGIKKTVNEYRKLRKNDS